MPSQHPSTGQVRSGEGKLLLLPKLKRFSVAPATAAVKKATTGRATVIIGSISAKVIAIESIPDSGVDIINAVVAPLFAPCFRSNTAAGSTPHDHKGIGIPIRAALNTERNRPCPK